MISPEDVAAYTKLIQSKLVTNAAEMSSCTLLRVKVWYLSSQETQSSLVSVIAAVSDVKKPF